MTNLLPGLPTYSRDDNAKSSLPELKVHNPLSNPKGVCHNCEICARESSLQCSLCQRTFYCSTDHQQMDWNSVHSKICPYLGVLRSPPPILSTQEQRAIRAEQVLNTKKNVLKICHDEAARHLDEGNPELAHPAGLQALRFAADVFGATALELVPPYLQLTEANIAAKLYPKAEEHLCQAKWILLQHPDADPDLKSKLSRNFGKLQVAQGDPSSALSYFASDVYFTSQLKGTDHIETSVGLYMLGNAFIDCRDHESAIALFEKVLAIWTPFLQKCLEPVFEDKPVSLPSDWSNKTAKMAVQIMKKIVESQVEMHGPAQIAVAQAIFTGGLLSCVIGKWSEAFKNLVQANQMFEVTAGSEHSLTRESHKYVQLAQKKKAHELAMDDEDANTFR